MPAAQRRTVHRRHHGAAVNLDPQTGDAAVRRRAADGMGRGPRRFTAAARSRNANITGTAGIDRSIPPQEWAFTEPALPEWLFAQRRST